MKHDPTGRVPGQGLQLTSPFLIVFVAIAMTATARAQVTSSISGRVESPTGTGVPGAKVTVKSVETGSTRTVAIDAGGNYRVLSPSGDMKRGPRSGDWRGQ